jgi:hypothetical protein
MPETITKKCRQCKKKFTTDRPKTQLCAACRRENSLSESRRKFEKAPPRLAPLVKSALSYSAAQRLDRQQSEHDANLAARLYADCVPSPVRVIRPGDPEFEAVAQEVTPIHRIVEHDYSLYLSQYHYLENGGFPVA